MKIEDTGYWIKGRVNATKNLKIQQKQTVYFDKDAFFDHKES